MATQPTLQGYMLPWPKNPGGYAELNGSRAVSVQTANGNLIFQRLSTVTRLEFVLAWQNISNSDYDTIVAAYEALLSVGGSSNFLSPRNATYTVTPVDGNPPLQSSYTETPAGGSWDVIMRLREETN